MGASRESNSLCIGLERAIDLQEHHGAEQALARPDNM